MSNIIEQIGSMAGAYNPDSFKSRKVFIIINLQTFSFLEAHMLNESVSGASSVISSDTGDGNIDATSEPQTLSFSLRLPLTRINDPMLSGYKSFKQRILIIQELFGQKLYNPADLIFGKKSKITSFLSGVDQFKTIPFSGVSLAPELIKYTCAYVSRENIMLACVPSNIQFSFDHHLQVETFSCTFTNINSSNFRKAKAAPETPKIPVFGTGQFNLS